jgi:uncharacterized membrane-anchored protein
MSHIRYGRSVCVFLFLLAIALVGTPATAQTKGESEQDQLQWQVGPGQMNLGNIAQLNLRDGYRFLDARGARLLMERLQNPTNGRELGVVAPTEGFDWFVVFEFDDVGYVKDDEKDALDAEALLASIRKGAEHGNKLRRERGWAPLEIVGWQKPPFYDPRTNNLRWAILGSSEGSGVVNYSTRLLGRGGVMEADLVLDPAALDGALPRFDTLLDGFSFKPGQRYAEFRSGDKVAAYGLTALVAGGAGAAAAKSGLLGKLWKGIVLAVVGAAAALRRFFARLFGRSDSTETPTSA